MKAYRVITEGIENAIASGENASKVRSYAIRALRKAYPAFTWRQASKMMQVARAPDFDDWAESRKKPAIVCEESLVRSSR